MPETKEEMELSALFERIGVTKTDRLLTRDLSKNAAQKALESIRVVCETVPDQRMRNVIMLSACLMVGEAAEKTILQRLSSAMDGLPPDVREKFDEMFKDAPDAKPKPQPQRVRDFDGKWH